MGKTVVSLAVVALCGALAAPASAAGTDWHLRVFAAGFDPDTSETIADDVGDEIHIGGESDLGIGAGLEVQFTDRFGFELGIMEGRPKVNLSADIPGFGQIVFSDATTTLVVCGDFLVHLTPASPTFDVYLGAGIANVSYGDLHYEVLDLNSFDVRVDDDLTWSVRAGLDIAFGRDSNWAAVGGLRYISSDLDLRRIGPPTSETVSVGSDIFNFTVGVAYSF